MSREQLANSGKSLAGRGLREKPKSQNAKTPKSGGECIRRLREWARIWTGGAFGGDEVDCCGRIRFG